MEDLLTGEVARQLGETARNLAGIARGSYTEADFERPTRWMVDAFGERGITSGGGSAPPAGPT